MNEQTNKQINIFQSWPKTQKQCCGLTWKVAEHQTVVHSLPPSKWGGEENWKKQSRTCELKLFNKIEKRKMVYTYIYIYEYM